MVSGRLATVPAVSGRLSHIDWRPRVLRTQGSVTEGIYGLILAVSVTAIEVGLIVTLMVSEPEKSTALARDTVFAGVMIVINLVVGLGIVVGTMRHRSLQFSNDASSGLLATLGTLAALTLVSAAPTAVAATNTDSVRVPFSSTVKIAGLPGETGQISTTLLVPNSWKRQKSSGAPVWLAGHGSCFYRVTTKATLTLAPSSTRSSPGGTRGATSSATSPRTPTSSCTRSVSVTPIATTCRSSTPRP